MTVPVMTPWMMTRIAARLLLLQARWDPARMQGTGFAFAVEPWLEACWAAEPKALLDARRRHLEYFNTHPIAAWLAAGMVCRQEAAAAGLEGPGRDAAIARVRSMKTSLGASLAGLYDSFFWGALRPASALAGVLAAQAAYASHSAHPLAWAGGTALAVYGFPSIIARVQGLRRGWAEGERACVALTGVPVQSWILVLRRATVAGALAAFVIGASMLGGADRLTAAMTFVAGLVLTWRGVSPLTQLGFVGAGGMAASAAGLWP